MNAAAGWVLGVDFGVVNTAAALRDPDGRATELGLSSAGALMPSAVYCGDQQVLVGHRALQAGLSDPAVLEPHPKRRLVTRDTTWNFVFDQPKIYVPELIAAALSDVLERSRDVTGDDIPEHLVLTYPNIHPTSRWETSQVRDGLQEAANLLVCRRCELIPVSTAVSSFIEKEPQFIAPVVVVNFGATSSDAVLCTRQHDGAIAAIASRRLDGLGAFALETRVREWVRRSLQSWSPDSLAALDAQPDTDQMRLHLSIRNAISALSATTSAKIRVDIDSDQMAFRLDRDQFDVLAHGYVNLAVDLTREMLAVAHRLIPSSTPVIILTGSAARNPTVRTRIAELGFVADFGDPSTIIARGAAYYGTQPNGAHAFLTGDAPAPLDDRGRQPAAVAPPDSPVKGEPAQHATAELPTARRLFANVTCDGRPCKKSLAPNSEHQVEVRIALPGPAEKRPIPHDAAIPDGDRVIDLLIDVSSDDGSVHDTAPLVLPMFDGSVASTVAVVKFISSDDGSTLRLNITALYKGRPVQTALLLASVRAKPAWRDRIRLLPIPVSVSPEPRRDTTTADATVRADRNDAEATGHRRPFRDPAVNGRRHHGRD